MVMSSDLLLSPKDLLVSPVPSTNVTGAVTPSFYRNARDLNSDPPVDTASTFLTVPSPWLCLSFERESLTGLELTPEAGQAGEPCQATSLQLPRTGITNVHHYIWFSNMGSGD